MTTPYYEDDLVTLFCGDALQVRPWLIADVLVTDPPYGIAYASNKVPGRADQRIAGDDSLATRDAALEMWGDRPGLVFGRWDQPRPAHTRHRLVWDKINIGMGDLSMPWGSAEEEIYVVGHGFTGRRSSNIIRAQMLTPQDRRRPDHPTPKPVPLMEALIAKCPPGIIADPFAGSGATLIAARNLGRRAIGVELDPRYCEMIVRRLSQQAFVFDIDDEEVGA